MFRVVCNKTIIKKNIDLSTLVNEQIIFKNKTVCRAYVRYKSWTVNRGMRIYGVFNGSKETDKLVEEKRNCERRITPFGHLRGEIHANNMNSIRLSDYKNKRQWWFYR